LRSQASHEVPEHSPQAIDATVAFAEYVWNTYGRFPAHTDAFKAVVACQAHHLDEDFYDAFYPPGALSESHRGHMHAWHAHA
jgi:hypothetical protein